VADLIRIIVADDDALVRAGLRMMLGGDAGFEVVAEAADGVEAVAAARRWRPDVVLMDIRMPRMDGLAAIEALRADAAARGAFGPGRMVRADAAARGASGAIPAARTAGSAPAVVVLTTFDTDEHVMRALRLGACGFLLKDTPPRELIDSIRRVAAGESMLSPAVVARLIDRVVRGDDERRRRAERARAALARLTDREREVAAAVGDGRSNAQIGAELHMSVATIKTYVSRILDKLECANRVQVAILVHEARAQA
jgi:DNA-binding NarL/FixJ family response regulator